MLNQIATIARTTFIEAIRQPIFFFMLVICGLLQILNTWGTGFSMDRETVAELEADNKLLFDIGLSTIFGCGVILAAFISSATISREIENKTALTVISKPVQRFTLVLGKYLGVTAAILMATFVMLLFLLLAIRHGVLSTAADHIDGPVWIFTIGATILTIGLAAFANFFYAWSFTQCASLLAPVFFAVAYLGVLGIGKEWEWQSLGTDFKPRVTLACVVLAMAILVLTSVAVAASTRVGQVMTLLIAAGVFIAGLVSNHFLGTRAIENELVGYIREVQIQDPTDLEMAKVGSRATITLEGPARTEIPPGASFYYGPNPSGLALAVPEQTPFIGDPQAEGLLSSSVEPAMIVEQVDGQELVVRMIGGRRLSIARPPEPGDAIFLGPTEINAVPFALWAVLPNMQHFWLIDAITQNRVIPPSHVGLAALYAICQILAFLALGVALFERRDIG